MSERKPSILRGKPGSTAQAGDAQLASDAAQATDAEGPAEAEAEATATSAAFANSASAGPMPHKPVGPSPPHRRRYRSDGPVFYVAGFWRRSAAAAVDLAIIVPVSLLMAWLAGALTGIHLPASRHRGLDFWLDLLLASDPALLGFAVITLAIAAVYVLVFQISLARTLGMRLMKLRIIDQYGDHLSTPRAIARTSGYLAAVTTLGLGFVWIGFDSEKRGLHDWIAGTYVVKA